MHNIKDNPDAMKEIAKEMKKAAKKKKEKESILKLLPISKIVFKN